MDFLPLKSPCVGVCSYNQEKICLGCFRTKEEISSWKSLNIIEQKKIWNKLFIKKMKEEGSLLIKDPIKRVVAIKCPIKRIVSYDLFVTKIIDNLGLKYLIDDKKDTTKADIIFINKKDFKAEQNNLRTLVSVTKTPKEEELTTKMIYKILHKI
jgi:uncharacterized protein